MEFAIIQSEILGRHKIFGNPIIQEFIHAK